MAWYVNSIRKHQVFVYKNWFYRLRFGKLHVYWDINDDKGMGFWNDKKNIEYPLIVSYYQLVAQGFKQIAE